MEYIKLYIYVDIQLIHISSKNIVPHSLRFINILASNMGNTGFGVWEDTFNKIVVLLKQKYINKYILAMSAHT